ncbi:ShlB/FhaC/HecB family hemolysin secretion/activation protein [Caenimonas sp. SL110]|uniref:ShlB/FhaC/HecB family hemolysin secretion/activation protein n=1 Tax=Caenimonas sp. SL110 TaxID=1450524 RepID=UPI000654ADDE|nr:ShlB/FhaC/HecB family hemolysin secretion/activation protein [Caenimonas sp. SL110]
MVLSQSHKSCCVRRSMVSLALLALAQSAVAQQPPGAGVQLLQIPPAPVQPRAAPQVRIEQRTAATPPATDEVQVRVQSLRVTGATVFAESDLVALTGFVAGAQLSLSQLQAMAARITGHYRQQGYFVALAYLPAQEIKDNAVTIAVSEGRYGSIAVRNATHLSEGIAQGALQGLGSGDYILQEPLESRLLVLSELPGVVVSSTLAPGVAAGTSDLLVDITPGARFSGSVDADNAGNRYTGQYRVGATLNLNNPLGLGDVASLRVLTSGSGLRYARASWQRQLGRGTVGVAYSWLGYELGKEFESLQAHGTARVASVFGRYPIERSRSSNLYAQLNYDWKTFNDRVDSTGAETDRKSRVLTASVFGDRTDTWGGGGYTTYLAALSSGVLDIQTPAARAADAITARSDGSFGKLAFNASRVQRMGVGPFSVYAGVSGQVASKNLDSSEKMVLGGMNAVRAYPEGEAYADEGVLLNLELRYDLAKPATLPGYMQLVAFVDAGSVTINHSPWVAGTNHRTLSGAGFGVNWGDPGNFQVRAYYAHKLGNQIATSAPDRSGRFWVQMVKYF